MLKNLCTSGKLNKNMLEIHMACPRKPWHTVQYLKLEHKNDST